MVLNDDSQAVTLCSLGSGTPHFVFFTPFESSSSTGFVQPLLSLEHGTLYEYLFTCESHVYEKSE